MKLPHALLTTSLLFALAACSDDRDEGGWDQPPMDPGDGGADSDDGDDDGNDGDDEGDGGGTTGGDDGGGTGDGGDDDGGGDTGGDDGGDTGGDTGSDGSGQTDDPPGDSPYEGGWDIGNCQDSVQGTASQPGQIGVGDVLFDWTLPDAFGDQVRFYDFCHKVIYYVVVAEW